jgi:hypothetical protein
MSDNNALENQLADLKDAAIKGSDNSPTQSLRMVELIRKEKELEAVKAALSGGQALLDVESAAKAAKVESPERYLAIGALRLLVKGSDDPSAAQAFEKALEMNQWNVRLKSVCAAQAGMVASGLKVDILEDCKRVNQISKKKSESNSNNTAKENIETSPQSNLQESEESGV